MNYKIFGPTKVGVVGPAPPALMLLKYLYNSLEKVEKRLKSFSSHALDKSHTKIKVFDNPTQ